MHLVWVVVVCDLIRFIGIDMQDPSIIAYYTRILTGYPPHPRPGRFYPFAAWITYIGVFPALIALIASIAAIGRSHRYPVRGLVLALVAFTGMQIAACVILDRTLAALDIACVWGALASLLALVFRDRTTRLIETRAPQVAFVGFAVFALLLYPLFDPLKDGFKEWWLGIGLCGLMTASLIRLGFPAAPPALARPVDHAIDT